MGKGTCGTGLGSRTDIGIRNGVRNGTRVGIGVGTPVEGGRRALMWLARSLVCLGIVAWVMTATVGGAEAAKSQAGTTMVTFNIAEAIEVVEWPDSSFELSDEAVPGVPLVSSPLEIRVRSNAPWEVHISSDNDGGLIREYDVSAGGYVPGGNSIGPLEWATSPSGPWEPLSTIPAAMFINQAPTGQAGDSVTFYLRVTPSFDDEPLSNGREYRIMLHYTVGVSY